jgi:energy-coupling factor transporter ATP-binding protein EcfA2
VLPLPTRVCAADLPPDGPSGAVWVGLGGAYGTPVALPVEEGRPVAVVGPHGSGRSTALAHIRRRLEDAGRAVLAVGGSQSVDWAEILAALEDGAVVIADDVEGIAGAAPSALPSRGTLVASYSTATAAAFRPPTPLFHARPRGVLLWPSHPGGSSAFGAGRGGAAPVELTGPRAADPPGRGRLVAGGRSYSVQLAAAN